MSNPTAAGTQVPTSGNQTFTPGPTPAPSTGPAANLPSGHASLYVGDLDEDVTEAMIYDKFSQIGNILSIRVCRDMITRKSLGYAYVNFSTPAEAEKAIDALNFDLLRNRKMRIMWSQRDPSLRKSGVGNLFIKNLDKSIVVRDLHDTFSTMGDILSCKIATDEKGVSKGYGFVHFVSKEAAETAIKKLHGKSLMGKTVYVAPFVPRNQRSNQGAGDPLFNNVFVKNFGEDMTDEKLKDLFSEFGDITSHVVIKNDDGSSRGFGFVCFKDPNNANQAVASKNGSDYNGRSLFVGRAMKKAERTEQLRNQFERKKADKTSRYAVGVNLYVKNLDDSIDDDALRKEFVQHGNITSVKVMRDQLGRSKGFGFVCFTYPDEATKAVTEMNGKLVGGKPLYVALAQRKEERHAHLQSQMAHRQIAIRSGMPVPFQGPNMMPNPHAFQNAPMNAPMNMYSGFPGGPMAGGHNPAMGPGPGFFQPFPARPLFTNIGMPQRQNTPRWANMNAGNPTGPGGPQGVRTAGGMVGYPPSMIRLPQAALQQRLIAAGQPGNLNTFAAQNQQPQSGPVRPNPIAVQQPAMPMPASAGQPGANSQPRMLGPNAVVGVPSTLPQAAQVQYTMNARNIQQPPQQQPAIAINSIPPSAGGNRVTSGQAGSNEGKLPAADGIPLDTLPGENFVATVQSADPTEQKQLLGEKLYSMIKNWHPEWAGKLTGMLLEIENRELLAMIMDHREDVATSNLRKKVDSALQVLVANKPQA